MDSDLRPEVQEFVHAMESTLRQNDYKGGWKDCSPFFLFSKMADEVVELGRALLKERSADEIRAEAVDVANYAMMIFDVVAPHRETDGDEGGDQ